jgi:hypothetical protein
MASSIKHNVRISQSVVYTIQKPRSHNAFFLIIKSDNHNILLKPTHTPTTIRPLPKLTEGLHSYQQYKNTQIHHSSSVITHTHKSSIFTWMK